MRPSTIGTILIMTAAMVFAGMHQAFAEPNTFENYLLSYNYDARTHR